MFTWLDEVPYSDFDYMFIIILQTKTRPQSVIYQVLLAMVMILVVPQT